MANRRLDLDVVTTGDTSGLAKTAAALDVAARSADGLGDQARQAGRGVDELGDETNDTADELGHLERKIVEVRAAMAGLAAEFDRTGDEKVVARYRAARGELGQLEKVAESLGNDGGRGIGAAFMSGMRDLPGMAGGFFSATGPVGVAAVAAVTASLLPALGAALAGGALSGAAAAGIVTGITAAARDPRIAAAWVPLKDEFVNVFDNIGAPFVAPVLSAMKTIKDSLGKLNLQSVFSPLAGLINPITDGLFLMAQKALPGIKRMFEATVPVVLQLVDEMPGIGEAIGDFAESMAAAGPGAAKFFHVLLAGAEVVLTTLGDVIEVFSKVYDFIAKIGEKMGIYDFGKSHLVDLKDSGMGAFQALAGSSDTFLKAAGVATDQVLSLKEAVDKLNGSAINAQDAEAGFQAAIDDATAAAKEHGRTLNLNTDAGRQNWAALKQIIEATQATTQATYDSALATGTASTAAREAEGSWNRGRDAFIAAAMGMGKTRQEATVLADRMMDRPDDWHFKPTMDTSYVDAAIARVKAAVASMPRSIGAGTASTYAAYYYNQVAGHAAGGPIVGPGSGTSDSIPTMLSNGEHVWSAAEVQAAGGHAAVQALRQAALRRGQLATAAAGSVGGGAPPAASTLVLNSAGSRLDDLLIEIIRVAVDRGGGNAQAVLGRRGA